MALCGLGAAAGTFAALPACGRAEGRSVLVTMQASRHCLPVGMAECTGLAGFFRIAVGGARDLGAALFWGGAFGAWVHRMQEGPVRNLRDGAALGAIAGGLDYVLLPWRMSPGWELALATRSAAALTMAGMTGEATISALAERVSDAPGSPGAEERR